jgi:hypothetical protein
MIADEPYFPFYAQFPLPNGAEYTAGVSTRDVVALELFKHKLGRMADIAEPGSDVIESLARRSFRQADVFIKVSNEPTNPPELGRVYRCEYCNGSGFAMDAVNPGGGRQCPKCQGAGYTHEGGGDGN